MDNFQHCSARVQNWFAWAKNRKRCGVILNEEDQKLLRPGALPGEVEGDSCVDLVELVYSAGKSNLRCGRCSIVMGPRRGQSPAFAVAGQNSLEHLEKLQQISFPINSLNTVEWLKAERKSQPGKFVLRVLKEAGIVAGSGGKWKIQTKLSLLGAQSLSAMICFAATVAFDFPGRKGKAMRDRLRRGATGLAPSVGASQRRPSRVRPRGGY